MRKFWRRVVVVMASCKPLSLGRRCWLVTGPGRLGCGHGGKEVGGGHENGKMQLGLGGTSAGSEQPRSLIVVGQIARASSSKAARIRRFAVCSALSVDGPVQIHPPPGDLGVGLVRVPAITGRMSTRSCCVNQQRREVLLPAEDADVVVDVHSAFGQQLFHIAIAESVTEIPAHCQHDHLPREPEASKRRSRREDRTNTAAAAHARLHWKM